MSLLGATQPFGKDTWLPGLTNLLEQALGAMFKMVDAQDDWRVDGRNIFGKVSIGDSLGQGVTPESGDFPQAEDPTYAEFKLAMARLSHNVELSFDEFELLNSNDAAAVPIVQEKMTKGAQKMQRDAVRQMWMIGDAKLARTTDTAAALTVVLSALNGDPAATPASQIDRDRFNWIAANRALIDIVDATTGVAITNGTRRKVIAVNRATNTITLDTAGGNVDPTANTVIVWTGSVASVGGAYTSREFPGILAAIDDTGTYLNIPRSATPAWQSTVVRGATPGTNEPISLDRILRVVNTMALAAENGMQPSATAGHRAVSNFGVQAAALEYLAPGMRFTVQRDSNDFAMKGFQQEGIPVLGMDWQADTHAPHNNLFIQRPSLFRFVKPKRPLGGLLDFIPGIIQGIWNLKPGAAAGRWAAAANAIMTGLLGLMTADPSEHGRLDDIGELGV